MKHYLAIASLLISPALFAQAGDQPFEDVGVIELEQAEPETLGLGIGWNCDALVIDRAARYRPGSCRSESSGEVTELTLEQAEPANKPSAVKRQNRLVY